MSLRLRLALVVAVTFALVVIGCTYAAHVSTSRQLGTETDDFLLQRAERFTRTPPGGFRLGPQRPGGGFFGREGPAIRVVVNGRITLLMAVFRHSCAHLA